MNTTQEQVAKLYGRAAEHKITMKELAQAAGVSRVTLSLWRHDKHKPTMTKYYQVESALDQMIADLRNAV